MVVMLNDVEHVLVVLADCEHPDGRSRLIRLLRQSDNRRFCLEVRNWESSDRSFTGYWERPNAYVMFARAIDQAELDGFVVSGWQ